MGRQAKLWRSVRGAMLVLLSALGLWMVGSPVYTAPEQGPDQTEIVVTTAEDELNQDGDCSLREAIQASNSTSIVDGCAAGNGADIIHLPAGTYTLTLTGGGEDGNQTGDLDIVSAVVFSGTDMATTVINGNEADRVLHVHPGANAVLERLSIVNGRAPEGAFDDQNPEPGANGGGILNEGSLLLTQVAIRNNVAGKGGMGGEDDNLGNGGHGGAIFNSGALSMTAVLVTENAAGQGGDATCFYLDGSGGDGGRGGGLYNQGRLWIRDSRIDRNHSGLASSPGCYQNFFPNRGSGGGLYNVGTATLISVTVAANQVGSEHNGSLGGGVYSVGHLEMVKSRVVENRARLGGGIFSTGALTFTEGIIASNLVSTSIWMYYIAAFAEPPGGGGVYLGGSALIERSTVYNNGTDDAPKLPEWDGYYSSDGFHSGDGGGIYTEGMLTLRNSTVSGNRTGNGGDAYLYGGSRESAKGGNAGSGAGIANRGQLTIDNSTITANQTGLGGQGATSTSDAPIPGLDGKSGGLAIQDGQAVVRNTILVGNLASGYVDCAGSLASATYSWLSVGSGCIISGATTSNVSSHLLGLSALDDFGGPTPTHMPLAGSPAVNSGSCQDSQGAIVATDQRGEARPQTEGCDIGAVESPHAERSWHSWLPTILQVPSDTR